ncbi:uncharacterized protein BO87DRAFT_410729 [Aspergillus neoniger CBS 115656]|uniref:Uncharacterized protein n=1 Tax=Aspergillus neoniger (strain CBS 115656) TaxID=1448310 RepID=A0A318YLK5_ASPNB|nr:hypothetical protein BO87DRAFT_410729 [Aspergillus neoniger CBS 115656]PYH29148.1 hypothetical protein BO87DRAFT_410729 [Aspergillus neoniger CBS 115656]
MHRNHYPHRDDIEISISIPIPFQPHTIPTGRQADDDTTKAIKRALSDNDIQTIFFVNLLSDHDDKATLSNLNASRCMLTTEVEKEIYDKVQRNELPTNTSLSAGFKRGAERVEVLGDLLRKLPYQQKQLPKMCKYLMASSLSHGISTRLELVAKTIAEMVVLSGDSSPPHRKRFGVLCTSRKDRGPLSPHVLRYNQYEFDPVGEYLRSSLYVAYFVEGAFKFGRKGSTIEHRDFQFVQDLTDQRSMDVYLSCPYISTLWIP